MRARDESTSKGDLSVRRVGSGLACGERTPGEIREGHRGADRAAPAAIAGAGTADASVVAGSVEPGNDLRGRPI